METPQTVRILHISAQEKEKQLKSLIKSASLESPEVHALQNDVRKLYEQILAMDCLFASISGVEQNLWKSCFHRRIEDYRKRIDRYISMASSDPDRLFRTRKNFLSFISDASTFFDKILELYETEINIRRGSSDKNAAEKLANSIHRCYIFLGDLARYRILYSDSSSPKDFSMAENFYQHALLAVPHLGNPHNQMAVIATYNDAECVAVYRYCRSLLIRNPFMTARDNLIILFERNRHKLKKEEVSKDDQRLKHQYSVRSINSFPGKNIFPGIGQGKGSGGRGNTGALLKSFLRRFVRIHGILFTADQSELDGMLELFTSVISDFRTLLYYSAFGDALLLKMVVICTFTIIVTEKPCDIASVQSLELSDIERKIYFSWALALTFGIVAQIGGHVRTQNPQWPNQIHSNMCNSEGSSEPEADSSSQNYASQDQMNYENNAVKSSSATSYIAAVTEGKIKREESSGRSDASNFSSSNCMKSVKKNQNSCQARPLGSRLLGPVVLFCDWLKSKPHLNALSASTNNEMIRDEKESSNSQMTDAERENKLLNAALCQERAKRAEFWEVVCHLANTLPDICCDSNIELSAPLKEHAELEGYSPFDDILFTLNKDDTLLKNWKKDAADNSPSSLEDNSGSIRIKELKNFCKFMSTNKDFAKEMKLLIVKDSSNGRYFTAIDGAIKADADAKPNVLKQVPMQSSSGAEEQNTARSKFAFLPRTSSAKIRTDLDCHVPRYRVHDDSGKLLQIPTSLKHSKSWQMPQQYEHRDQSPIGSYVENIVWSQHGYPRRDDISLLTPKVRDNIYSRGNEDQGYPRQYHCNVNKLSPQFTGYDYPHHGSFSQPQEIHSTNLFRARSQPDVFSSSYSDNQCSQQNNLASSKTLPHFRSTGGQYSKDVRSVDYYSSSITPTPLASWKPGFASAPGVGSSDYSSSATRYMGSNESGLNMFNSANTVSLDYERQRKKSELLQISSEESIVEALRPPYSFNFESSGNKIFDETTADYSENDKSFSNYEDVGGNSDCVIDREKFINSLSISMEDHSAPVEKSTSSYSHYQMFSSPYPLEQYPFSYGVDADTPKTVVDKFSM